jgi:hypothetical protein
MCKNPGYPQLFDVIQLPLLALFSRYCSTFKAYIIKIAVVHRVVDWQNLYSMLVLTGFPQFVHKLFSPIFAILIKRGTYI